MLGVRAVLAESYERIHRSNLVMMGILPLQFCEGENAAVLGIDGTEDFSIPAIEESMAADQKISVYARKQDGREIVFQVLVRVDTSLEKKYINAGGILPYIMSIIKI